MLLTIYRDKIHIQRQRGVDDDQWLIRKMELESTSSTLMELVAAETTSSAALEEMHEGMGTLLERMSTRLCHRVIRVITIVKPLTEF